jgi:hypothetical protein
MEAWPIFILAIIVAVFGIVQERAMGSLISNRA